MSGLFTDEVEDVDEMFASFGQYQYLASRIRFQNLLDLLQNDICPRPIFRNLCNQLCHRWLAPIIQFYPTIPKNRRMILNDFGSNSIVIGNLKRRPRWADHAITDVPLEYFQKAIGSVGCAAES